MCDPVDPEVKTSAVQKHASAPNIGGCGACGIQGIHACPGRPIPSMTPEQVHHFKSVLSEYTPALGDVKIIQPSELQEGSIVNTTAFNVLNVSLPESISMRYIVNGEDFEITKVKARALDKIEGLLNSPDLDGVLAKIRLVIQDTK